MRWSRLTAALAAALALAGPGAAPAAAPGLSPAAPPEIVAGARSCLDATDARQVDQAKLTANGWNRGSVTARDGKAEATPLTFMAKGGLVLILNAAADMPLCAITTRLAKGTRFGDVAAALEQALGVPGKPREGDPGIVYFFPEGHLVQLASTGSPRAPAVRVVVAPR